MMEWINKNQTQPVLKKMLVVCKKCNEIHAVIYDYKEYNFPEMCTPSSGATFAAESVDFDWYMPLPKPPEIKDE